MTYPLLAAPNETLREHIEGVAEELINRFLKKRARTLSRLLRSYNIDVNLRDVEKALLYSAIFHDVGKAYDWFQERIVEAALQGLSEFSVPRHELFSALATSHILAKESFASPSGSQLLRTCVLLSIVWSHSSSRGAIIPKIAETIDRFVKVNSVSLNQQRSSELVSILDSVLKRYECYDGIDLSRLPRTISITEVKKLLGELDKPLRSESKLGHLLYHVTLPVVSALQVADSLVSNRNRGGKRREYIADLPDPLVVIKVKRALWSTE